MPARRTSPTVRYGRSVAAGVELPMAAWLVITRASVMCVILSLSARVSELLVGPEGLSELGNGVVRGSPRRYRRGRSSAQAETRTQTVQRHWNVNPGGPSDRYPRRTLQDVQGGTSSAPSTPKTSTRLSESHVDCAASISLRLAARSAPARNMFSRVKNGVSGTAGGDLPMAAWLSITRGSVMCVMIFPLSCPQKRAAGSRFETRRFGVCLRCKSGDVEPRGRRRMADGPAPEPAVAHGLARGFLVFNLPD